ncbi:MAG TPA: hypothetical protein VFM14_04540 [Gemmatimonadales bacterium]|nr:hypothetical protein [Gemmatimonadales bacterium]
MVLMLLGAIWLAVVWFLSVFIPDYGVDAFAIVVLLVGFAIGVAVLVGGFYLGPGAESAAWILIGVGGLWSAWSAVGFVDSVRLDFAGSTQFCWFALLALALAALALGLELRRRDRAARGGARSGPPAIAGPVGRPLD